MRWHTIAMVALLEINRIQPPHPPTPFFFLAVLPSEIAGDYWRVKVEYTPRQNCFRLP